MSKCYICDWATENQPPECKKHSFFDFALSYLTACNNYVFIHVQGTMYNKVLDNTAEYNELYSAAYENDILHSE